MPVILVAEDEHDIRELIAFTLRFKGYTVQTAADGEEAVTLAASLTPDLVLLDVRMPRLDGYDACRRIKALPGLELVPVVFLSAKGQEDEIQAGYAAGACDYLLKPFSLEDLASKVQSWVSHSVDGGGELRSQS